MYALNAYRLHSARQTASAITLAALTTFAVLAAMGALADRYQADQALAHAATLQQQAASASVTPARG